MMLLTVSAVEISYTEHISGTALGSPVKATAGHIGDLTLLYRGGKGQSQAGEDGGDGGDGELHICDICVAKG